MYRKKHSNKFLLSLLIGSSVLGSAQGLQFDANEDMAQELSPQDYQARLGKLTKTNENLYEENKVLSTMNDNMRDSISKKNKDIARMRSLSSEKSVAPLIEYGITCILEPVTEGIDSALGGDSKHPFFKHVIRPKDITSMSVHIATKMVADRKVLPKKCLENAVRAYVRDRATELLIEKSGDQPTYIIKALIQGCIGGLILPTIEENVLRVFKPIYNS